jgi:hypothetical protein
MNSIKRWWIVAAATVLGLLMFTLTALAQEPYDIQCCGSGTVTMLSASKELTIVTLELRGISQSLHTNKVFDKCTWHAVGLNRIVDGKVHWMQYRKYMDPDGDTFVIELSGVDQEGTMKFLEGTGKWKGLTGGGKAYATLRGKPITPGTTQYCGRATGTYELKK